MTDNDRNLIVELEKRLCWYRDEAAGEEFDAEEVDAICVLLQRLSPVEEPHMSKEEAYRNIMRRVREEDAVKGTPETECLDPTAANGSLEEPGRTGGTGITDKESKKSGKRENIGGEKVFLLRRKGHRAAILFIAVFGAAVLSLNMVTYAREDKSLFTMILERVGLVEIVKEGNGEDAIVASGEETGVFYESWVELDSKVKSKIMVPEYIPDKYIMYGIRYYDYNNREKILVDYYDKKDGHLLISITLWEGEEEYREMAIDENGHILLQEYSDKNTLYYQYEDEYICMVSMKNSFYRISGNITLDEMIKIREGLKDI